MKEEFLKQIKENPRDLLLRKAFADWLDEFGDDSDADEAVVQREWTVEKQDAIELLEEVAAECEIDVPTLIEAAKTYAETGERYCLNTDTPDSVYDKNVEIWKAISLLTGRSFAGHEEDNFIEEGNFFRCAC